MTLLDKFLTSSLDTTDIGLDTTPRVPGGHPPAGAAVIGWEAGGAVHYCTLLGQGDAVFAVEGGKLHAVASSFEEFLSLLLACGSTSLLRQAWGMSRSCFLRALHANPLTHKQRSILRAMQNCFGVSPCGDPYSVLSAAHQSHDAQIPWAVTYRGGFSGGKNAGAPGKQTDIQKQIAWGGRTVHIPAVFACKEGVVADILVEIPAERIRNFTEKWSDGQNLTPAQQMTAALENPTELHAEISLALKKHELTQDSCFREFWNPMERNDAWARILTEHYGCDQEQGWLFLRCAYRWPNKSKAPLRGLTLCLNPLPCSIPGDTLTDPKPGHAVSFPHPVTAQQHTLTVDALEPEGFDYNFLADIPNYCQRIRFTVEPDLPVQDFWLMDAAPCDQPRFGFHPEDADAAIGIIGSSDGPVAIYHATQKEDGHTALSSLRYAPPSSITWQMVFRTCLGSPVQEVLIP